MLWSYLPMPMEERLVKLEEELDKLINIQEEKKNQHKNSVSTMTGGEQQQNCAFERCLCTNITACSRTSTIVKNHQNISCCTHNRSATSPLCDITKFLQSINFNLNRGTLAISKIANSTLQQKNENIKLPYHDACIKKDNNAYELSAILKTSTKNKFNEDDLYRELREEKDKRIRAENQAKSLKEELKSTRSELQQKAVSTILSLQTELKITLEKLEVAQNQLDQYRLEFKAGEHIWPLKFKAVSKELQEERVKRNEAERNVHNLQELLQRQYIDSEDYISLQRSVIWLKDQNQNLTLLTKGIQIENENIKSELQQKDQTLQENVKKIKQLITLCEKLRDNLIITRARATANEDKLTQNMTHCQKLTTKLMEAQSTSEELSRIHFQQKQEQQRLSDLLQTTNNTNQSLQERIEEISEVMKQQNELIARQSDTINNKDEQIKLAISNIKLQALRLNELEGKVFINPEELKERKWLECEINQLAKQLQNEKETILIKEKIVDDHIQTIKELKNNLAAKEEEISYKKREVSDIERKFAIEKTVNEQLHQKIINLQNQKEELKEKVIALEEELETQISPQYTAKLEEIEKQVKYKQKEWEVHKLKLIKEKDDILKEFNSLSQSLMDKTADFQMKSTTQQGIIDSLKVQFKETEDQLRQAEFENSKLKIELSEAIEKIDKIKKHFEDKLIGACESWKKTMQELQTQNVLD